MAPKTVTLIGATGLIGSHLLLLLQNDMRFKEIRVLVRRPLPIHHLKTAVYVVDFTDQSTLRHLIAGSDTVFCTIGTTQKKVKGDKAAYRQIDFDIPVTIAKICAETGTKQFLLVSSAGANPKSNNFYLGLKGQVEQAIQDTGIPIVSIFRPSMLLGSRHESRRGEKIMQGISKAISFVLPSRFKPIHASEVANAMAEAAAHETTGVSVYHYNEIRQLANS